MIGSVVPVAGNLAGGIAGFIVGAATGVGVDYGILVIDEKHNRKDKEAELITELQNFRQRMLTAVPPSEPGEENRGNHP